MTRLKETLSAFKNQVKHVMQQMFHLPNRDKLRALEFFQKYLDNIKSTLIVSKPKKVCPKRKILKARHKYKTRKKTLISVDSREINKSDEIIGTGKDKRENNVLPPKEILSQNMESAPDKLKHQMIEDIDAPVKQNNEDCLDLFLDSSNNNSHNSECSDIYETFEDDDLIKYDKKDGDIGEMKTKKCKDNSKKHICYVCNTSFIKYELLIRHLFNHEISAQTCYKCRNVFQNAISFKLHLNINCTQLNLEDVFQNVAESLEYASNKVKDILICPYCGQRFTKSFNFKRHLSRICSESAIRKQIDKNSKQNIHCDCCSLVFNSEKAFEKHQKNHEKGNVKCPKCDSSFPTRALLRAHHAIHRQERINKYKCQHCAITFPNRMAYRQHKKEFRNDNMHNQGDEPTRIWCELCKISFYDQYTYERHCTRKNHLKIALPYSNFDDKPIICEKCGIKFELKSSLTNHNAKFHSGKEFIKCGSCEYKSYSKSNIQRHMRSIHEGVCKAYACDKCPSLFSCASGIRDHVNSVHSEIGQFSCDICFKRFKLKNRLSRHKTTHTSILPFACVQCSVAFKRRCHLTRHMLTKHKEQDIIANKHVMSQETNNMIKKESESSTSQNIMASVPNIQEERVFSLIDAQSGELVTLSAKELSKNAVINMSDGTLLNEVHLPELWHHQQTAIYSLNPMQDSVLPQPEYNIITHNRPEMEHVLQSQISKDATMPFCIPQATPIEHISVEQTLEPKGVIPQFMCVCVYENSGA